MNTEYPMSERKSALKTIVTFIPRSLVRMANFTRHIILLIILYFFISLIFFNRSIEIKENTALVLAPLGNVVNQYSGTPSEKLVNQVRGKNVPEVQMRDLIKAILSAADDKRISVLVLKPDYIWQIGLADLKELEAAIDQFKARSNKPVIALAENMTQNQYYFASLADEIILDPQAFMFFRGYGSYRNYYKEGLDKLGVDVHLFRVGEYKSAAEPYIRNDMSPEAKESALHYMSDLWNTYLSGVASRRNIDIDDLKKVIENQASLLSDSQGNMAQMYKKIGLVDQIKSEHFKNKYIASLSAEDSNSQGYRYIDFQTYVASMAQNNVNNHSNKIAVVVAEGTILDGEQSAGTIGGLTTSAMLRRARLDNTVKAVVLRVNSPGGAVFASEQIRREVDAIKVAGKPVIVSMGNIAASGGYWISMTADKIYASDATITGSIGIYGMFMTYPRTLEKIGIHTDGVGTSSWAGAFRTDRALDEDFSALMQSNIEHGYQQFITAVAMARGMSLDLVDTIARGRVWSAKQARDLGLIDEIGGLSDALDDAAKRAKIGGNYDVVWVENQLTFTQKMVMSMLVNATEILDIDAFNDYNKNLQQLLSPIQESLRLAAHAQMGQMTQYAHCFCEIKP